MRFPFAITLLLLAARIAAGDVAIPPLRQHVTDLTGTLSPAQHQRMEQSLVSFEAHKGSQIAVLILPTTAPETIEGYSIRVVDAWKLGRKEVDDGVLLLVAKDDRTLRIEVGHGLEGALPDAIANRIINEIIVPCFKSGDFEGGIEAGVARIVSVIDGEPLPEPPPRASSSGSIGNIENIIVPLMIGAMVLNSLLRSLLGRLIGGLVGGGVIGAFAWMASHSLLVSLIFGGFTFLIVALNTGRSSRGSSRGFGGGGFSSSSRSSSGGGFSGGGGSFGGGGASGRW